MVMFLTQAPTSRTHTDATQVYPPQSLSAARFRLFFGEMVSGLLLTVGPTQAAEGLSARLQ